MNRKYWIIQEDEDDEADDDPLERVRELEIDPDGKPILYQLYTPEQDQQKDPNMYLWVRRCELFISLIEAVNHLKSMGISVKAIEIHSDFKELIVVTDVRDYKWYICRGPIHGTDYTR